MAFARPADRLARLRTFARRLVDLRLGSLLDLGLPTVVAAIGGASSFGLFAGWKWAAGYLTLYGADKLYGRLRQGGVLRAYANSLEQVNGKVAGVVDTLAMHLARSPDGKLGDAEAHAICASLLARIKDHAVLAYQLGPDAPIRVTLAVPHASGPDGRVDALRVWCYDGPHPDRRYSTFALTQPGAATAFVTGAPQIIADVNAIPPTPGSSPLPRRYASVASVPVVAGGVSGSRLAAVSLDMRSANFFTRESLEQQLLPNVAPIVNLVALTLTMRRQEDPHEFGR